jgi:hypothetical protein
MMSQYVKVAIFYWLTRGNRKARHVGYILYLAYISTVNVTAVLFFVFATGS